MASEGIARNRPQTTSLSQRILQEHRRLPARWRKLPLGICLSAGGDSTALALAAAGALKADPQEFPEEIILLHARHELRGAASRGDALAARELAGLLGLPYQEVAAPVPYGPGLEARARSARYQALRAAFPGLLATAHHRSDQAETVLLRILRGAGPLGLRGIASLREDGVWRPFLEEPRSVLQGALKEVGWTAREDASNADTTFLRNLLRHRILPALEASEPGWESALSCLARSAARLRPLLEERLEELEVLARLEIDPNGFSLCLLPWEGSGDDPELILLLERAWSRIGRRPWSRPHLERLLSDTVTGRNGRRRGGQDETAIFGGRTLRIESSGGRKPSERGS